LIRLKRTATDMSNWLSVGPNTRRNVMLVAIAIALGGSTALVLGPTARASVASPVDAGEVVVVDATNPSKELTHGGSATKFSLRLPADATCPGDSAHDQWRVQSFLVPATDDPANLVYGVVTPDGDGRWSLVDGETHPFINVLTPENSQAGLPGQIGAIPAFSFVLFPPGTLPDGRYHVGIACTYFAKTAKYWDTELVMTTSPDDVPGQLTWRVTDAPKVAGDSGNSAGRWVALGSGCLAIVILMFVLWQRSARQTRPLLKEPS
jgi:hypothetical protein